MANFIRFRDSITLRPVEIKQEVKDFYAQPQNANQPLRIRVAATHAGKVTRNNGFYLPHKMRAGVGSWTAQYNKPVQVHHDDHADPVGRVIEARYVDISGVLVKKWDSLKDSTARVSALEAFCEGKLHSTDSVNFVGTYFLKDQSISDDPDYEGLGYIELVADITDPDAIRKVLDKRYLTGSVGASTNEAICSVCKKDWASEGEVCDHRPGKIYDGVKCVLIAGDLTYDEWSFVNRPADSHSAVIEVNFNGVQDFVQVEQSEPREVSFILDSHNREDESMTFKHAIEVVRANELLKDQVDLEKVTKEVLEKLEDKSDDNLIQALMEHFKLEQLEGPPEKKDEVLEDDTDPLKAFWGDQYEEIVGDDEWGVEYARMVQEALSGELLGEDGENLASYFEDAKLTAAGRKKLSASVFCKPPRGYPVNDCGHAKSAMAYAKKNNEASSVVACIRRKAKRLGCPFSDDVEQDAVAKELFSVEYFDALDDEQLISAFDALLDACKERDLQLSDATKFEEQIKKLQDEKTELADRITSVRREIGYLYEDIDNLQEQLAEAIADRKSDSIASLMDMKALAGEVIEDVEQFTNSYTEKTFDEVKEELKTIKDNLDIKKLSDTLNSGLANNQPEGTIDNPLPPADNKAIKQEVSEEQLAFIRDAVAELRRTKGQPAVVEFINSLKERGILQ